MNDAVMIPTTDYELRTMMIKLMGRGLTMSQSRTGHYVLRLSDILDLIYKITQRVRQQNHGDMSDFFAEFEFDDGSLQKVPSYSDLERYRSIAPCICTSARLSFAFLIDFNSGAREKQTVDIEIKNAGVLKNGFFKGFIDDDLDKQFGKIEIRVEYTDVTWAHDIVNLFEKYVEVHFSEMKARRIFISLFGLRSFIMLMLPVSLLGGMLAALTRIKPDDLNASYQQFLQKRIEAGSDPVNAKLDIIALRELSQFNMLELFYPVLFLLLGMIGYYFVLMAAKNLPYSAIVLSPEAEKVLSRAEGNRSKVNLAALLAAAVSVGVAVFSNSIDRFLQGVF